jgi:hypothetical protein
VKEGKIQDDDPDHNRNSLKNPEKDIKSDGGRTQRNLLFLLFSLPPGNGVEGVHGAPDIHWNSVEFLVVMQVIFHLQMPDNGKLVHENFLGPVIELLALFEILFHLGFGEEAVHFGVVIPHGVRPDQVLDVLGDIHSFDADDRIGVIEDNIEIEVEIPFRDLGRPTGEIRAWPEGGVDPELLELLL